MACDIPEVNLEFVRKMLLAAADCDAVVPQTGPDFYEPLFAVYRKSIILPAQAALAAGKHRIRVIFPEIKVKFVPLPDSSWYRNLNSPEDVKKYQEEKPRFPMTNQENGKSPLINSTVKALNSRTI